MTDPRVYTADVPPEHYWPLVEKTPTCWNWTGQVDSCGRPFFQRDNRICLAVRVAWHLAGRPAPAPKTQIAQTCTNLLCVNPEHLVERATSLVLALKRFWSRVNKNGPTAPGMTTNCWLWTGGTFGGRYGHFWVGGHSIGAHRFSLEIKLGRSLLPDMCACHTCDVGLCLRPDHLFEGTQADNVADRVAKGHLATGIKNGAFTHPERRPTGSRNGHSTKPESYPRGENHHAAKLTTVQVVAIRLRASQGERQAHLAREYGISATIVGKIVKRQLWKEI